MNPLAPARSRATAYCSSGYAVRIRTGSSGLTRLIWASASTPFRSGMEMSSSTTSHGWLRMNDSACTPVPASPTTSQVGLLGDELLQAGAHDGVVVGNQDADGQVGSRN